VLFANLLPKVKTDHLKHIAKGVITALFTIEGIKDSKLLKDEGQECVSRLKLFLVVSTSLQRRR